MNTTKTITDYIKARYGIVVIESHEEERVLAELTRIAASINHEMFVWNSTLGVTLNGNVVADKSTDLKVAIDYCENRAKEQNTRAIFVFCDAHNYLTKNSPAIYRRRLKDFAMNIRARGYRCSNILISPAFDLDDDLQKEVAIIDFPLPSRAEVSKFIREYVESCRTIPGVTVDVDDRVVEQMTDASVGLTKLEIENCLSRALVGDRRLDRDDIADLLAEKKQQIRKSGILEYIDTGLNLNDVGGLETIKRWLDQRGHCFEQQARDFGIRPPKGVLLTGVPGRGKSLTAKCVASAWGMPLLRLDMGKIFQGIVGSSEQNMRRALRSAEAIAPCILWVDEIEKGLAGTEGGGDSGTSTRVFGTLLTWMQEKTAPVFVFATANNINRLPPELLRKGRFDEIFFVDFPRAEERKKILEIHLKKLGRDLGRFNLDSLAALSGEEKFGKDVSLSGAEIEAWVADSLIEAYGRRLQGNAGADLEQADFETTIGRIVPMGQMRKDEFTQLRQWADHNAVSASAKTAAIPETAASATVTDSAPAAGRFIDF